MTTHPAAFILASLLTAYPAEDFLEQVSLMYQELSEDSEVSPETRNLAQNIHEQLLPFYQMPELLDNLRSVYIDLFDRSGRLNSLYETEYGKQRAIYKGNELIDIAGFYKAFGMEMGQEGAISEMVDHLSVELEFYAILLIKNQALEEKQDQEGILTLLDARCKFLKEHLGPFVKGLSKRPEIVEDLFFSEVFNFTSHLVDLELNCLNITLPEEKDLFLENVPQENEELSCGNSIL